MGKHELCEICGHGKTQHIKRRSPVGETVYLECKKCNFDGHWYQPIDDTKPNWTKEDDMGFKCCIDHKISFHGACPKCYDELRKNFNRLNLFKSIFGDRKLTDIMGNAWKYLNEWEDLKLENNKLKDKLDVVKND